MQAMNINNIRTVDQVQRQIRNAQTRTSPTAHLNFKTSKPTTQMSSQHKDHSYNGDVEFAEIHMNCNDTSVQQTERNTDRAINSIIFNLYADLELINVYMT